jgi:hypothetical protein
MESSLLQSGAKDIPLRKRQRYKPRLNNFRRGKGDLRQMGRTRGDNIGVGGELYMYVSEISLTSLLLELRLKYMSQ